MSFGDNSILCGIVEMMTDVYKSFIRPQVMTVYFKSFLKHIDSVSNKGAKDATN